MESNDNGTLPEVQIRKLHISATGTSLRKPRQEIRGNVMSSQKSGSSGSRPVPESEHKKAGSKTLASCERTQIPEDHLLRRTVVTTGFSRSGLVQPGVFRIRNTPGMVSAGQTDPLWSLRTRRPAIVASV